MNRRSNGSREASRPALAVTRVTPALPSIDRSAPASFDRWRLDVALEWMLPRLPLFSITIAAPTA